MKHPQLKQAFGVFSYPALKVLRGDRHRWLYTPKQRTAQMIVAAAAAELDGPYRLLESAREAGNTEAEVAAQDAQTWLDANPLAPKEDYQGKLTELESRYFR